MSPPASQRVEAVSDFRREYVTTYLTERYWLCQRFECLGHRRLVHLLIALLDNSRDGE